MAQRTESDFASAVDEKTSTATASTSHLGRDDKGDGQQYPHSHYAPDRADRDSDDISLCITVLYGPDTAKISLRESVFSIEDFNVWVRSRFGLLPTDRLIFYEGEKRSSNPSPIATG
jgi:hypothetical protein